MNKQAIKSLAVKFQMLSNFPNRLFLKLGGLSFGRDCFLHRNIEWSYLTLQQIKLGSAVSIHRNCSLFIPLHAKAALIKIGSYTNIGDGTRLYAEGHISIGDGCLISSNVHIADSEHNLTNVNAFVSRSGLSFRAPIEIGNNCFIGRNSIIFPGTALGNNCRVGANCIVKGYFPDDSLIVSPLASRKLCF